MLHSRQELSDYCLRALGAPVINIEVADEQLEDAIETAIQMFQEYHSDGIDRDYVKHRFADSTVTVVDASLINVKDVVVVGQTISYVKSKLGNVLTVDMMQGPDVFAVGQTLIFPAGSSLITAVVLGDKDKKYIDMPEGIFGIIRVMPWQGGMGDGLFDVNYQLRMNDMRNLTFGSNNAGGSGGLSSFTGTMQYLAEMDFVLRKEKQFRFNRRMNKLYLDIDWNHDVTTGDYAVIEVYRAIDDLVYSEVLNDIWLKKYAVAVVKKYWGANLRKYQGITLPGGLVLDGERIYAEANAEIKELEFELIQNQAPLSLLVG